MNSNYFEYTLILFFIYICSKIKQTMSRVEVTQETTPLSDGILKTDLPIDGTLQTVKDQLNNSSTLQISNSTTKVNSTLTVAERLNIESDSTVSTQTSSVIQSTTTNANLVIAPNGTGALIADIPDGILAGGNARGLNAVDLQMFRGNSAMVASGNRSVIVGGNSNTASGTESVVVGGNANTASSSYSVVSGGQSNTAFTNTHATVGGGFSNAASGQYSTIAGGDYNTASGNASFAVGDGNVASGTQSSCIGGRLNTASNSYSVVAGIQAIASGNTSLAFGNATTLASGSGSIAIGGGARATAEQAKCLSVNSTVSASFGAALGGSANTVGASNAVAIGVGHTINSAGTSSVCLGSQGTGYLNSQIVHGSSLFAQSSYLNSYINTTINTAGTAVLSLDGTGVTGLIIPFGNFRAWNVQVNWVAVVVSITGTATGISAGDVITSVDLLAFKRVTGTSSVSSHTSTATKTMVTTPAAYAACAINYTAGASQEMAMTFTGPTFLGGGSLNMRVVAKVELAEVNFQL
jgi:hypothetical protein